MKTATGRTVISAMFAALTCVATMIIKIPSPLNGYINLGDAIVLLSAWILSPGYGFAAAGIGSALADLFSGYSVYAPATFVIKGLMALTAYIVLARLGKRIGHLPSLLLGGALAEIVMILGYFIFEGFLYGFAPSLVNIPANGVQGIAGLIIGIILLKIFEKQNLIKSLR